MVGFSANHQSAANTTAEGHIKDRIKTSARPVQRFAQRCDVRVIINRNRKAAQLMEPPAQIKVRPPCDLMRAADFSRPPIDRSAEAHPDGFRFVAADQFRQRLLDLVSNAGRAARGFDPELLARENLSGRISHRKLQFGATDFDAKACPHENSCGAQRHGVRD